MEKAIFGAGCFWGVQYYFDQVPGVVSSVVGYSGGNVKDPTYEQVCSHTTGHAEVVELEYEPSIIDYENLLRHFFRLHDPTQLNRQGPDVGDNYRSVIYYFDDKQKELAEKIIKELTPSFSSPIVTEVSKADIFYKAEEYHQKYAETTGRGMCHVEYKPI
jgi:methionine-S-sulfoxide reductase